MRNVLNSQGHHFAHTYPARIGLTSSRLGLRDRKADIILWHERYAIEDAAEAFNTSGSVFFLRA
jgi:hypothetical protein